MILIQSSESETVSISGGNVPSILLTEKEPHYAVAMTVNFLRSGCPMIQLLNSHKYENIAKFFVEELAGLEIVGEKFIVACRPYGLSVTLKRS